MPHGCFFFFFWGVYNLPTSHLGIQGKWAFPSSPRLCTARNDYPGTNSWVHVMMPWHHCQITSRCHVLPLGSTEDIAWHTHRASHTVPTLATPLPNSGLPGPHSEIVPSALGIRGDLPMYEDPSSSISYVQARGASRMWQQEGGTSTSAMRAFETPSTARAGATDWIDRPWNT